MPVVPTVAGAALIQRKALASAAAQQALEFMKSHRVHFRNNGDMAEPDSIAQMSPGELIAGLDVLHVDDVTEADRHNTNNFISATIDNATATSLLRFGIGAAFWFPGQTPTTASDLGNMPDYVKGAVQDVDDDGITENGYDDGTQKVLRSFKKKRRTDRYYCSKEYHEWQYHVRSAEYSKVYDMFDVAYNGQNGNNGFPTQGEWVDSKTYRRLVEMYRRVNRLTTGPGFKRLIQLMGTTRPALINALLTQNQAATLNMIANVSFIQTTN